MIAMLEGASRALTCPIVAQIIYESSSGAVETMCRVVEVAPGRTLLAEDLLGDDAVRVVKASLLPAAQIEDVPARFRRAFATPWRALWLWDRARTARKPVESMRPGIDYSLRQQEIDLQRWINLGD